MVGPGEKRYFFSITTSWYNPKVKKTDYT